MAPHSSVEVMDLRNNVRVISEENIVMNPTTEVRVGDEWVDIKSSWITGIKWVGEVGAVSRIHFDMVCPEVRLAGRLDAATLETFAAVLREAGWEASPPRVAA